MDSATAGLSWALFFIVVFLIFIAPLIMGFVFLLDWKKSKWNIFWGLVCIGIFGLILWYEPTRTMFLGFRELF